MIETRWCPHCGAERPLSEFYTNRAAASGVDGYCKTYRKEKQRERARRTAELARNARVSEGLSANKPRTSHRIDDQGRECSSCGRFSFWSDFHLDRTSTTGHQTRCKSCVRQRQRSLSATDHGRAAARRRTADYRARKRGPDWTPRQVTRHAQLDCDGVSHRCTQCGLQKPVVQFPRNTGTPCGFDPRCTQCRNARRVERRATDHNGYLLRESLHWNLSKYGITAADFNWLLDKQSGGCALCGESELFIEGARRGKTRLSIDHDHDHCGPARACRLCIRGLLCHSCNVGLGKFEYKAQTRTLFAHYLDKRPFVQSSMP